LIVAREHNRLSDDALRIWRAGLAAVDSRSLVRGAVSVQGNRLRVDGETFDLAPIRRILVIGAGKAGAGMAEGLEEVLGPAVLAEKRVAGWINVPADCVRQLRAIHLHAARPPGQNEPTPEGAAGSSEILRLAAAAEPDDLCIALISGGGSALLPAPAVGISLAEKLAVTRHLSAAGADIRELNTVRKQLSSIKGGGLRRACRAGRLVALIISDVIGDPLDIIASGPTVEDSSTPAEALAILEKFQSRAAGISESVFDYLLSRSRAPMPQEACAVTNVVIGNNDTATDAAARTAKGLGYSPEMIPARPQEGTAENVGRHLADRIPAISCGSSPDCLISGGEPVVQLVSAERRGLGGRNQQLVLAAAERLGSGAASGFALLSGGTDGEDGPTDAAGAVIDPEILAAARERGLAAQEFLARDDAYHFFEPLGALVKTGPTHTNVCDVRVIVVDRAANAGPAKSGGEG
jgi:hydroxypyruvate reductase